MKRRRIWLLAAFGVLATWMAACGGGGGGSALGVGGGGSTTASDPNPPDSSLLNGATAYPDVVPAPISMDYVDRDGNSYQVLAVPGRVMALFKIGVSEDQAFKTITANEGAVISKIPRAGFYYIGVPLGKELSFVQQLRKYSDIVSAEFDFVLGVNSIQTPPTEYHQVPKEERAYLEAIDFVEAHALINNNSIIRNRMSDDVSISILVLDVGFNENELDEKGVTTGKRYMNDLAGRIKSTTIPNLIDESDHGFKIANILGANWNNDKPVGINPYSPLYLGKLLSLDYYSNLTQSCTTFSGMIYYILEGVGSDGIEVLTCSLLYIKMFPDVEKRLQFVNSYRMFNDAVRNLNSLGKKFILTLCAGQDTIIGDDLSPPDLIAEFPKEKNLIIVGAYQADIDGNLGGIAAYSHYGIYVDVFAPGYDEPFNIKEAAYPFYYDDGSMKWSEGTSFSTPIVAGVISIVWEINPTLSPSSVVDIIKNSAQRHNSRNYENKVVNFQNAVNEAAISVGIGLSYPTIVTNNPLVSGAIGTPYSQTFVATGGVTPYTWSISDGGLPPGLILSTTGVVSGVPSVTGHYTFTVEVTTASSVSSAKEFTIDISGQGLLPAPTNPLAWYTDPSLNNIAVVLANTVATADSYRLYSSTDNVNFSQVNFTPQVSGNAVAFDALDVPVNTYFKIAAVKAGVEGDRSNAVFLNFSQKNSLPRFGAVSPLEGATGVSLSPVFQWESYPGAAAYVLLSETPTQGNVLVKLSGTSWTLGSTSNVITKYVEHFTAYLPNTRCDYAVWAVDSNGTMIASIAQAVHFTTRSATTQNPVISTVKELSANDYIYPSIAAGPGNKAYISYVTYNNFSSVTSSLSYADNASGSWTAAVLDSGDVWASCPSSIAVDSSGYYHIAYDAGIGGVIYRTNKPGSPGITSIDSSGGQPDLAMGPDGALHVAYWGYPLASPGTVSINYATNSSGWTPLTIKGGMDFISGGQAPSIAVDGSGKVHIAHVEFNAGTLATDVYYVTNKTGSWVSTKIDSALGGMLSLSIAVENGGTPHICYFDQVNLIYLTNVSGPWTRSTIPNTGSILPPYISNVAVDSNGKLYVAYGGYLTGEFRYVTNWSGAWSSNLIESGISVFYSSIAVGSDGSIHAVYSYLGTNNNGIKYAYIPGP